MSSYEDCMKSCICQNLDIPCIDHAFPRFLCPGTLYPSTLQPLYKVVALFRLNSEELARFFLVAGIVDASNGISGADIVIPRDRPIDLDNYKVIRVIRAIHQHTVRCCQCCLCECGPCRRKRTQAATPRPTEEVVVHSPQGDAPARHVIEMKVTPIMMHNIQCAVEGLPGSYTDVYEFKQWRETMGDDIYRLRSFVLTGMARKWLPVQASMADGPMRHILSLRSRTQELQRTVHRLEQQAKEKEKEANAKTQEELRREQIRKLAETVIPSNKMKYIDRHLNNLTKGLGRQYQTPHGPEGRPHRFRVDLYMMVLIKEIWGARNLKSLEAHQVRGAKTEMEHFQKSFKSRRKRQWPRQEECWGKIFKSWERCRGNFQKGSLRLGWYVTGTKVKPLRQRLNRD